MVEEVFEVAVVLYLARPKRCDLVDTAIRFSLFEDELPISLAEVGLRTLSGNVRRFSA